jgi:hypothetical protein
MQFDRPKTNLLIGGMIIFILVLVVGLAVKPRDFFREARNATRKNHMQVLMTAVYSYAVDNNGSFPDCIPEAGRPAVSIKECYDELSPYLLHLVLADPDPKHSYMIEYAPGETEKIIRIFSTAPEAKNLEIVR